MSRYWGCRRKLDHACSTRPMLLLSWPLPVDAVARPLLLLAERQRLRPWLAVVPVQHVPRVGLPLLVQLWRSCRARKPPIEVTLGPWLSLLSVRWCAQLGCPSRQLQRWSKSRLAIAYGMVRMSSICASLLRKFYLRAIWVASLHHSRQAVWFAAWPGHGGPQARISVSVRQRVRPTAWPSALQGR